MVVLTTGVVTYIHYGQYVEKTRMREGIVRDVERMNIKAQELGLQPPK